MANQRPECQLIIDLREVVTAQVPAVIEQVAAAAIPALYALAPDSEVVVNGLGLPTDSLVLAWPAASCRDSAARRQEDAVAAAGDRLAAACDGVAAAVGARPLAWWCSEGAADPATLQAAAAVGIETVYGAPFESDKAGEALSLAGLRLRRLQGTFSTADELPEADGPGVWLWRPPADAEGRAACLAALAALPVAWASPSPLPARPEALPRSEVLAFATRVGTRLHPCRTASHWLSVAEQYGLLCRAVAEPELDPLPLAVVGHPTVRLEALPAATLDRASLSAAAAREAQRLATDPRIPGLVMVGEWALSPSVFLYCLARLLASDAAWVKAPDGPLPLYDAGRRDLRRYTELVSADCPDAPWIRTLATNLPWTARPCSEDRA